ncbi:MAG: NAD(P)/FAD-dependent oxidoreductase [Anaeroplasmataceae bacterium]|nr:NAD(P)/FAD-dependent oxidoreductase [Anaeroplasmataceae bacterium]
MKNNVIVIGKGPAGISCAVYLKRYGLDVIIIGRDGGALEKVATIDNYYGFYNISGKELLENGYAQAKRLGIEIKSEEVVEITKEENFSVITDQNTYEAGYVVLACGTSRNRFVMAEKFSNVSYCATCDGFFYRKKKIGLIGNSTYMAHELSVLENMCKDITVFTNGLPLDVKMNSNILVVQDKIISVLGEDRIQILKTEKQEYPIDGLFIALGQASGYTFAKHLGIETLDSKIVVDQNFQTNIKGLYACGDLIGGLLQVAKAVADGANCATSIQKHIQLNK